MDFTKLILMVESFEKAAQMAQEVEPAGAAIFRAMFWKQGLWPTMDPKTAELDTNHKVYKMIMDAISQADPEGNANFQISVVIAPNGKANIWVAPNAPVQNKVAGYLEKNLAPQLSKVSQQALANKFFLDADGEKRQFIAPPSAVSLPLINV